MSEALWYFGRAAGVSALVLFSLVVTLGAVVRTGRPLPGLTRFTLAGAHRTVSLTAVGFLLVHMLSLLADPYAQLRLVDLVLPFAGAYRPLWQGLGTVGFDLVVLLIVSSLLRSRIGLRTWRAIHWTAYLCWPVTILHVVGNGTDRHSTWLLGTVALCIGLVVTAVGWRAAATLGARRHVVAVAPPAGLAGLR